ncbi:DUF4097 family beta strand repeat-containing protein [Xylanibacillus composti]|nr:DUF4097 family beta strand repeat-containing protein [Xylanibacillus composti]
MRAGRITGALLIIYTGIALLLDLSQGTSLLLLLVRWWPAALVLLGVEYLILTVASIARKQKLNLDWGSVVFALIVIGVVIGVFHGKSLMDEHDISIGDIPFSDESGEAFELPTQVARLDRARQTISVTNHNGDILIVASDIQEIAVDATVIVSKVGREEAERVAEGVEIAIDEGDVLAVQVKSGTYKAFGVAIRPKVNLQVTVPASMAQELQAVTANGKITVSDLHSEGGLSMQSTNGSLTAERITGEVSATVTNGAVKLMNIEGAVHAMSTNGQVVIEEVAGAVQASSTNGRVDIRSSTVGGDWKASTTLGALSVSLPEDGDFVLFGKVGAVGSMTNELGLELDNREIHGSFGSGRYRVELETSVGSLSIHKQTQSAIP